jgi:hypothetical protein
VAVAEIERDRPTSQLHASAEAEHRLGPVENASRKWAEHYSQGDVEAITVSTITLDDLLAREGITSAEMTGTAQALRHE